MEATVAFVKMCRNFIAITIVVLFLSELHCHYILAYAGASHVTRGRGERVLQVENGHARRIPKLGTVQAVNFGSAAALVSTSRRVTSYRGGHANTSRSRQEVAFLTVFKAVLTSDPMGVLKSWHANDSSVCGWIGVVCSSPQHPKHAHVIGLELGGRQLVGNITPAMQVLCNLPFLQRLDLSNNVFRGSIPAPSLNNCSELSYLNVSDNQLTGPVPWQLGELVNLKALDMTRNNLTGEIPASLGNCTLLRVLDLGSNFLEGRIPWELGRLSRLEFLTLVPKLPAPVTDINYNPITTKCLSGSIPPALGNCSSLTYLDVQYNSNLGGKLPFELSQLKRLQSLLLTSCGFEGVVPTWLGNLTGLSQLSMRYNRFQGELPDVMGQLQDLNLLYLGLNNLSGVIPISITNCTKLIHLDFGVNKLTGDIPPELGTLRNLEWLGLLSNSFRGAIPSSIANCSALTSLELGSNPLAPQIIPSWMASLANLEYLYFPEMNLRGEIPEEIGRLSSLGMLVLTSNNLSGVIPPSLANCTLLTVLDFMGNALMGEIPPGIGQLTYLSWLGLSENFLAGSFPAAVTNLSQMETLMLSGNSLAGTIDGDFGRLQLLQLVDLSDNQFRGSIPGTLSNCSNLFSIYLIDNSLSGEIPHSMGNLTRLEVLWLGYNNIRGTIPADIVKCSRLGVLSLRSNNFEGSVLPNIGQLSSLQTLHLAHNNFTGVLPSSLGNCSVMYELDLSYNQFTGHVPGDIFFEMASLTYFNLSHNLFSGAWPPQLSQLSNLREIDVSVNNISGPIPPSLESCSSLVRLDVSFNILTGVIPQSLGLLRDLDFLNASYNNFEGPIPETVVSNANLSSASFLGNPRLCGPILGPHRTCSDWSRSCKGFKCKKIWIPTMFGLTVVGAALIVVGVLCWMNIVCAVSGRNEENEETHLMLNFVPHVMRVSERDVLAIIQGGDKNVIGIGAKSIVYKGVLPGGSRDMFAIKILRSRIEEYPNDDNMNAVRRDNDLVKEVRALAQLRHRHILKVFSFCSTLDVQALILEYMPEGCLHKHLHELGDACQLTWQERFNIVVGVAEAMVYLHHGYHKPLIHGDLKPSNILLDSNLEPKVADFGLSKFAGKKRDGEATASTICGTVGYMPPEYAMGTSVSTKGDVYSYGVVLIELLTGTQPTSWENFRPSESSNFKESSSIMELLEEGTVELLDSTLKQEAILDSEKNDQMMLLMRVALFCTKETPDRRPSMEDVLTMLKQIKETGLVPSKPRTVEDLAHEPSVYCRYSRPK